MNRPANSYDYDFAVAGGGPAGTSAAICLAQKGHRVILFEKEQFPRFHIGESLLSTANDAFATLGVTDRMEAACFPPKWGARLYTPDGRTGRGVDFTSASGITRAKTYQVCREQFDAILLERAREVGVEVREGHRVSGCEFDSASAILEFAAAQTSGSVRVRALVDASGRHGLVAKKLGLRKDEPMLANIAVFSHFRAVPRLEGERPDDIRLVARADAGWFWLIPISPELTSVGVVIPMKRYMQLEHGSPEALLQAAFDDTPIMAELMRQAHREWPVRVEKDFSYSASTYAGDRWILAGDAGSFLDPVFSSGVSIAMESGIEAATALDRAMARNDFSTAGFAAFSRRQSKRFQAFRRFVVGFYSPQFRDLFFSAEPPPVLFRAVVTVLAGNWNPGLWTRAMNRIFFFFVALQKRFSPSARLFRRDAAAGYPTEDPA
jgi:flavin-dependent dehydrogenase